MAAQPPPIAMLRRTTQMSLNERFTTLLKNTGPRPANIRPSGWQRPSPSRDLRRRTRHLENRPCFPEACPLGKTQARRRAAIGRGRDLLLTHRHSPLEGARGPLAPRTVLRGCMSPRGQDPLPDGLALAPQRKFRGSAHPVPGGTHRGRLARGAQGRLRSPAQRLDMEGPHPRAHFGAQGRGPGQGISPLNRPGLTKEPLDKELHAYMAMPKAKECLDIYLEAYRAQAVPDDGLDSDLDAYMADADSDASMDTDP